jgi:hypothetical protein
LELSLDFQGATIDERDRACGHADTLPADARKAL